MGRPRIIGRVCSNCGSNKTWINKQGIEQWRKYDGKYWCNKCHIRLIIDPIHNPINRVRRLQFKDKRISLKEDPRYGICQLCGAVRGYDCEITVIHHMKYHDDDPLKDTIEICQPCHLRQHRLLRVL